MKTLFSLLMLIVGVAVHAQVGTQFPDMETETSEDKKFTIPVDVKGKYTLVGLAYSKKSEDDLVTWFQPVYTTFIEDPGPMSFGYDVNVFFIPMFTGANAAAAGAAKKRAIKGIDPVLLPHLLFFKGDLKPFKKALDLEGKDTPYFFVINAEGKIVHVESGKCSEDKIAKIEEKLE